MKKFLFSLLLGLCLFLFNLDSSFAANTVSENTVTVSENVQNAKYEIATSESIKSVKKVKRADTVIVIIFDDGTVVVVVIRD